jgi:hypothetical protein
MMLSDNDIHNLIEVCERPHYVPILQMTEWTEKLCNSPSLYKMDPKLLTQAAWLQSSL